MRPAAFYDGISKASFSFKSASLALLARLIPFYKKAKNNNQKKPEIKANERVNGKYIEQEKCPFLVTDSWANAYIKNATPFSAPGLSAIVSHNIT
ncbi:hypothetical protein EXU30_15405 [Shewanella maritima]|uniref:Uncharacterized protein n=1 Tax=Shewanella maritima TaxID=2520507 RepID=A0A411PKC1_9GAMM|nr:hypothetical protein [Shewanella maritima]QBF83912.1 hypothetical protein EXU30_15405 [Shewanella maritima]